MVWCLVPEKQCIPKNFTENTNHETQQINLKPYNKNVVKKKFTYSCYELNRKKIIMLLVI